MTASFFIAFLGIFIWRPFMSQLFYLHQTFTYCICNQYWYVKMPDVTASYRKPLNFMCFFEFGTKLTNIHVWSDLSSPNFHILCILYEYKYFVIMKCQIWLHAMERLLILLCFFGLFLYIIDDFSFLKYCILTKFSLIVCLINTHILIYWYARCNYKLRKVLWFN